MIYVAEGGGDVLSMEKMMTEAFAPIYTVQLQPFAFFEQRLFGTGYIRYLM